MSDYGFGERYMDHAGAERNYPRGLSNTDPRAVQEQFPAAHEKAVRVRRKKYDPIEPSVKDPVPGVFTRTMLLELHSALFNNTNMLANLAGVNFSTVHKAVTDPAARINVDTIEKLRKVYDVVVLNKPRPGPVTEITTSQGGTSTSVPTLVTTGTTTTGNTVTVTTTGTIGSNLFVPTSPTKVCDGCQRLRNVPGDFYKFIADRPELRPTCKYCLSLERKTRRLGMHKDERFQFFRVYLGDVRWPPDPENPTWVERAKEWVRRRARPLDPGNPLAPKKRKAQEYLDEA